MELKERFLKYVGFDTQSDPESETYPSTAKQLKMCIRDSYYMVGTVVFYPE